MAVAPEVLVSRRPAPPAGEPNFASLLRFRIALRQFNRWSENQAAAVGLTHSQHQLLLAVKGHDDPRGPTIGEVADYLLTRPHSAVELINRVEGLGYLRRCPDEQDHRVVRLALTEAGADRILSLTRLHLDELRTLASFLTHLVDQPYQSG